MNPFTFETDDALQAIEQAEGVAELTPDELAAIVGGGYLAAASPSAASAVCTCPRKCCGQHTKTYYLCSYTVSR